ncbi:MAG: DUF1269 domain-containing protein [Candidatus Limnocylindria bacterium]
MNKILISVFDTEEGAFEGVRALKELHAEGDITMYASAVIAKDAQGQVAVRQAADRGPVGTLVGIVTGSLVGLLGGPVGMAVGAYVGGTGGVLYDLFTAEFGVDVVDDVSEALTPGKAALVADIDEYWVTPIETRLGELGATTIRHLPGEVLDEQLTREAEATKAELEQLQAELREESGEARAKVQAAIEARQRKLEMLVARVDTAIEGQKAELEARLTTLRTQWDKARAGQKERIDARIAELNASHEARQAKLQQARELAKKALEMTREAVLA